MIRRWTAEIHMDGVKVADATESLSDLKAEQMKSAVREAASLLVKDGEQVWVYLFKHTQKGVSQDGVKCVYRVNGRTYGQ